MTDEDDAFIRTIVDNPGQDVPRLVYADWLDDRDDPRGPFLRAEVEWAQPWKEGKRPGDAAELLELAAGLDPLWVARVARPPVGVCCDHFQIVNRGKTVTPKDIAKYEVELGYRLATEYQAFLLNTNGGATPIAWFPTPNNDAGIELSIWYSLDTATNRLWPRRPTYLTGPMMIEADPEPRPLLPIGDCGGLDWQLMLDVTAEGAGGVFFWEEFHRVQPFCRLSDSFAEFLQQIEARSFED